MWVTKMGCYHTGECHGVDSCINCPHGWAGPKCEEVRCLLLPCPAVCSLLLPFAALRLSSSPIRIHIDDHRFKLISPPRFCPERTLLITVPVLPLTVLSAYVVACCLDQVPGGLAILIIGLVAGLGNLYIYPPAHSYVHFLKLGLETTLTLPRQASENARLGNDAACCYGWIGLILPTLGMVWTQRHWVPLQVCAQHMALCCSLRFRKGTFHQDTLEQKCTMK